MIEPAKLKKGDIVILDGISEQDAYMIYRDEVVGEVYTYVGGGGASNFIVLRPHPFLNCGNNGFLFNCIGVGLHFLPGAKISLVCRGEQE